MTKMKEFKPADDESIYHRALQSDQPEMKAFIEWFDRGKKPADHSTPEKVKARELLMMYLENHTWKQALSELGVHPNLIGHIKAGRYHHFGEDRAKEILEKLADNNYFSYFE